MKKLSFKAAKKYFKEGEYIWVRVSYFSFGNSSEIYHLRIIDVCEEGIRVDAPSNKHALRYRDYDFCWEVYDIAPRKNTMKDRKKTIAFIKALEEAKVDDATGIGIIRISKEFRDALVAELKEWAK